MGSGAGSEGCGAGAPPDHPMPPVPVQCFSFNGRDKAEIVKWPEAKQACENQGAVLATISNPLEQGRSPPGHHHCHQPHGCWGWPSAPCHPSQLS